MGDRPQSAINRQMLDSADFVVAVFRSRFGSPTGVAQSGTEEEIKRAIARDKLVMVYFYTVNSNESTGELEQFAQIERLKRELQSQGLYGVFRSASDFESKFRNHLSQAVNRVASMAEYTKASPPGGFNPTQAIVGDNNVLAGGDVLYTNKTTVKKKIERRADGLSPMQAKEVRDLIGTLVAETSGKARDKAFSAWYSRLYKAFEINSFENLRPDQLPAVRSWYRTHLGMLRNDVKLSDPDSRRANLIRTCKSAMKTLGVDNAEYYPEVSRRLKLKNDLLSLKNLTMKDLRRVAGLMRRDSRAKRA